MWYFRLSVRLIGDVIDPNINIAMSKRMFFTFESTWRMDVFEGKISDIANSSLNLAQTQVYEVGLTPPCLLWVLQTSKLACYLATPWVRCLSKMFFEHFEYSQPGYLWPKLAPIYSKRHLKHESRSFFPLVYIFAWECAPFSFLLLWSFCSSDWPSTRFASISNISGKASLSWAFFTMD